MASRLFLFVLTSAWLVVGCAGKDDDKQPAPLPGPHDGLVSGAPFVLSPANPNGSPKDEDASIILADDDSFYVAWLSNRDGNDDLYVMRSTDGLAWGAPQRVTTSADNDWYPTIVQAANGRFHMVWMRQSATTRTVLYNSSADGLTWNAADEVPVTTGVSDDFVPYMIEFGGAMHVYFDSATRSGDATRNLFHVVSTATAPGGAVTTWSAPAELATANSAAESDQFAFVRPRPSGGLTMVWIRHAGVATDFNSYLHPSTDIFHATSNDGVTWSTPTPVMAEDGAVDTMPSLYTAGATEILTWMRGVAASPNVMELPLAQTYPSGLVNITTANGVPGWSPRVVQTLKANTYMRVWVGAADLRLYAQVFTG